MLQKITITNEKAVLFHTTHRTFQVQSDTSGSFPHDASWYAMYPSPANRTEVADQQPNSVLISAWIQYYPESSNEEEEEEEEEKSDYLVPELWQYMLPPDEECRCLNISEEVWDLELDLQAFVVVGHRAFFMGYSKPDPENAVWDVSVEVPMDRIES
jgi:hypothetical protein